MKTLTLSEDRNAALKQWSAVNTLIHSQEQQISFYRKKVQELENQLKLVDKTEIDALYCENERLTNLLEVLGYG